MTIVECQIQGSVATVTLNRPESLNSINTAMQDELTRVFDELDRGDLVRVVRVRGAGRAFTSGYDLSSDYATEGSNTQAPTDDRPHFRSSAYSEDLRELRAQAEWIEHLRRFRKPVVVQVHGYCLSGGLDLLAIGDIIVASTDCRIGHPASRGLGLPITLGLLPFTAGGIRTKQLLFTGDLIDGQTAEAWGIVNFAVDPDEIDTFTESYCQRIANMPLDSLIAHKAVTNRWLEIAGLSTALDSTVEFGAQIHLGAFYAEYVRIAEESGIRAALRWRDEPYAN